MFRSKRLPAALVAAGAFGVGGLLSTAGAAVTYTALSGPATGSTFAGTGIVTGSEEQITAAPSTINSGQDFNSGIPGAMAETFTPATTYALTGFAIDNGGEAGNVIDVELFDVTSAQSSSSGTVQNGQTTFSTANLTDLFGTYVNGIDTPATFTTTANSEVEGDFNVSPGVTLTAGDSYALVFISNSSNNGNSSLVWERSSSVDPGGEAFLNAPGGSVQNLETLNAAGAAGGFPRTFVAEFYGTSVPEPASLGIIGLGALGLMRRRSRNV